MSQNNLLRCAKAIDLNKNSKASCLLNKLKLGFSPVLKPLMIAGLFSFVAACSTTPKETFRTEHQSYTLSKANQLDPRQKADLFEALIAGDMASHKGDFLSAMSYYLYAAELSNEPQIIQKGVDAARQADDPLGLEQAAKIWLSIDQNDLSAQSLFLESQIGLGNLEPAVETAELILNQLKSNQQRYDFILEYIMENEPRLSFSLLRELKNRQPDELKQVPIITAQSKFIFDLSGANKSPETLLNQSLSAIEKALSLDNHFLPAIKLKSHILYQLRKDQEAVNYLGGLYRENPKSQPLALMLGQLLYDLRNFKASANHFTGWLQQHPDDYEARYYQAASYYALGQYHLSLENFMRLLGKHHEAETVAFYCGDSAAKTGDFDQAVDCFEMVKSGKFAITAKVQLAKLYAQKGQLQEGLNYLQPEASAQDNDIVKLLNAEVNLLDQFATRELAQQKLEESLKRYPDDLSLLIKKIRLYELTKSPKKLYELLTHAKSLMDSDERKHEFILVAARILRDNEHFQLSIDWLNDALKESPEDKEFLYTRALFKESLQLYDEMILEFKQLLKLFPDDLNIKNALGYTLADTGRELDYAQELIDQAYEGLPDNAAVIDSKGWVAFRKGEFKTAEQFLVKAFELQPSAEGAAHLGEVFWQTGKTEFAKRVFKRGLELDKDNRILNETLKRLKVYLK